MAPGRVHVEESLRLAARLGLRVPVEAHGFLQLLIDSPHRVPRGAWRRVEEECPHVYRYLSPRLDSGMRVRGVASHDWRGRLGRSLLYAVAECLYGRDARLLVDLHFALDDIWEGRAPRGLDPRVEEYLRLRGLL